VLLFSIVTMKAVAILLLAASACYAQTFGGFSGVYGETTICLDEAEGIYQYTYNHGFGFGKIDDNGNPVGRWVEANQEFGWERWTINDTHIGSYWWYETEGDADEIGPNPIWYDLISSDAPSAEDCWWLDTEAAEDDDISASWTFEPTETNAEFQYKYELCQTGRNALRGHYTSEADTEGFFVGTGDDEGFWFSGLWFETKNFELDTECNDGGQIFKLGGDGTILYDRYWCGDYLFDGAVVNTLVHPIAQTNPAFVCEWTPADNAEDDSEGEGQTGETINTQININFAGLIPARN